MYFVNSRRSGDLRRNAFLFALAGRVMAWFRNKPPGVMIDRTLFMYVGRFAMPTCSAIPTDDTLS